jgi:HD superfamily phosphodiesterase
MDYQLILKKIQKYVQIISEMATNKNLPYHNIAHTKKVVDMAIIIANHYQLNSLDFFVITASAWFHDVGYCFGTGANHEEKGITMAEVFLKENAVEDATIIKVKQCILATKIPQAPSTLCEQIVCDADLFHLGTDSFFETDKLMRKEYELVSNKAMDKKEWRNKSIEFLKSHHFHTDYCKILLSARKQENLDYLIQIQKKKNAIPVTEILVTANATPSGHHELLKEKKAEKPVRGIETMFRVASTNHQRLSDMADSKSHIMISVNSIIISVVIGLVVRKLETAQNLIIPTMILLAGSVTAVIFSVLATRPKIPGGQFTGEQLSNRTVNLLFFGNFYKMDYDHYYDGMKQLMNDGEFLYASLVKDIHSQGVVLGHKYKLLRISYTIFMFTLIISILAFAISIIFIE